MFIVNQSIFLIYTLCKLITNIISIYIHYFLVNLIINLNFVFLKPNKLNYEFTIVGKSSSPGVKFLDRL